MLSVKAYTPLLRTAIAIGSRGNKILFSTQAASGADKKKIKKGTKPSKSETDDLVKFYESVESIIK